MTYEQIKKKLHPFHLFLIAKSAAPCSCSALLSLPFVVLLFLTFFLRLLPPQNPNKTNHDSLQNNSLERMG